MEYCDWLNHNVGTTRRTCNFDRFPKDADGHPVVRYLRYNYDASTVVLGVVDQIRMFGCCLFRDILEYAYN